jgi:hypothetical protein
MDKARRKELIEQYQQRKPDMGIFIIRPKSGGKCHIQAVPDLKGAMNGALMRLEGGLHPVKELQQAWNEYGPAHFTMEVLETLSYDEDASKTDYSEELNILRMIWEERLAGEGMTFYKRKV